MRFARGSHTQQCRRYTYLSLYGGGEGERLGTAAPGGVLGEALSSCRAAWYFLICSTERAVVPLHSDFASALNVWYGSFLVLGGDGGPGVGRHAHVMQFAIAAHSLRYCS